MSSTASANSEHRQTLIAVRRGRRWSSRWSEFQPTADLFQREAFLFIHPIEYFRIWRMMGSRAEQENALGRVTAWLEATLAEQGIRAQINCRIKSIPSIYRKMQRRGMIIDEIHDIRGVRIIVNDIPVCYDVLDLVHRALEPLPDKFDDYIRRPKCNGYQSLHTVVFDREGKTFEIQIRTATMHRVAELGTAAHWRYKGDDHERDGPFQRVPATLSSVYATFSWGTDQDRLHRKE